MKTRRISSKGGTSEAQEHQFKRCHATHKQPSY
jgi:hypothetical protein